MVKNGYILNVSTNNIASFLDKVRLELKDVIREQVLMQTAKSTEWLYDMKFIEQRKYDASILDMALAMTAQRISGVALGAFKDSLFDFRSTLIIAKSDPDHQFQYVLLNAANNFIRYYFENLEEVVPFKFNRFLDEEAPGQEENEAHGIFWHKLFEHSNWNLSLVGYAAQLSVQPDVTAMGITAEELKNYFSDPEIRRMDYVKRTIMIRMIKDLLGSTPIEKTDPYLLMEYFERASLYLQSEQGEDDCFLLDEKVKPGFCSIDTDALTLS